jgi:N(2)-fixation sustaining protein CowN
MRIRSSWPAFCICVPEQTRTLHDEDGAARGFRKMEETAMTITDKPTTEDDDSGKPDRYITFLDIDFEANMRAVLDHLARYIDHPETGNAFWDRFRQKLADADAGQRAIADELLLMHAHVYYMRELFEDHDDDAALAALTKLEEECF